VAKPLLDCLHGKGSADAPSPIWLMRQAGRYLPEYRALRGQANGFVHFCLSPELAAEATLQPIRRFGMDGAILFADILLLPHALGREVRFIEGQGPVFDPLPNPDALAIRDGWQAVTAPVAETVRLVRAALPAETTLIGFAGAPWTVLTYLIEGGGSRDHMRSRQWAYGDPVGFQRMIDVLVETTIEYIAAQIEAGADAYQLFDSWAGALTADGIERWSLAPSAAIAGALRARYPHVPCIMFPRATGPMLRRFATNGAFAGIGIDSGIAPAWAAAALQPHVTVQGNLDSAILIAGGAAMREAVRDILDNLGGKGRHIFNLGHGITPETPPEHVAELVALVRGEG
jgi:uroporphyrinogen decarboxylase